MIAKEQKIRYPKLSFTVKPRTFEALKKRASETGNHSFIVNRALEIYLGLNDEPELEQKAS